jgi:hypothetical protein
MNKLVNIPLDLLKYINSYLQRTDQISFKLSNKYLLANIPITMNLDTELLLFTKTIDQMDYAWKNDHRYIQIKELNHRVSKKYSIFTKYAITSHLWYFDFNAKFNVVPDTYVILFLTSVSNYKINLELTDKFGIVHKSTYSPKSNKIKVKFDTVGKLKINCNEINNLKHNKIIQYIMCIPEYYWEKLKGYTINKPKPGCKIIKIAEWKKQLKYHIDNLGRECIVVSHFR